jgi:hypothetical protein
MSDSNPPPPPPPPPSPLAIADALHVDDPSAVRPRLHGDVGTVLFGANQPTSAATADLTPLPQHKRSAPSDRSGSTSSKARKLESSRHHRPRPPLQPPLIIDKIASLTNCLLGRVLLFCINQTPSPQTMTISLPSKHSFWDPSLNDSRTRERRNRSFCKAWSHNHEHAQPHQLLSSRWMRRLCV